MIIKGVELRIRSIVYSCIGSHTLLREEGCGHAATIELSPQQKLDVTNQICGLRRSHRYDGVQMHV